MAVRGLYGLYETMFRSGSLPAGSVSPEDIPTARDLGGFIVPGASRGAEARAHLRPSCADDTDEYVAVEI